MGAVDPDTFPWELLMLILVRLHHLRSHVMLADYRRWLHDSSRYKCTCKCSWQLTFQLIFRNRHVLISTCWLVLAGCLMMRTCLSCKFLTDLSRSASLAMLCSVIARVQPNVLDGGQDMLRPIKPAKRDGLLSGCSIWPRQCLMLCGTMATHSPTDWGCRSE